MEEVFEVKESDLTFDSIKDRYGNISIDLKSANALAIPVEGHDEVSGKVFHAGVDNVYNFFKEKDSQVVFDIYADDDEVNELSLHAADFFLGSFIVSSLVAPLFINLLSNYVYDYLKARSEDNIAIDVTVDNGKGKSKKVVYRGKIENLSKAIEEINKVE